MSGRDLSGEDGKRGWWGRGGVGQWVGRRQAGDGGAEREEEREEEKGLLHRSLPTEFDTTIDNG